LSELELDEELVFEVLGVGVCAAGLEVVVELVLVVVGNGKMASGAAVDDVLLVVAAGVDVDPTSSPRPADSCPPRSSKSLLTCLGK